MIYLDELLKDVDIISGSDDLHREVSGIQPDSRKIKPNNCFVAIPGFKENGLTFVGDAIANGANSIVFETNPEDTLPEIPFTVTWVQVENTRLALSRMAAAFYGYDRIWDSLYAVGVTGTNGKTTVMSLIHEIFNREFPTAKIGTLGMVFKEEIEKTNLTTPESIVIYEFLSRVYEQGCRSLVMEASSVGLKLHRVESIHFSQGIFTNFSGDHLDFHHTMEDYLDSKMILFKKLIMEDWAIINIDDPSASKIFEHINCKYLTYGFCEDADIRPLKYKFSMEGIQATLETPKGNVTIKSSLLGRVNLVNIMAAVASAVIKGISLETISRAIGEFKPLKGRLDLAYNNQFSVLIDYAHTDKALEGLLQSLEEIVTNKIILVFGAGGSRDKTKRPRMGTVACQYADYIVVTSDNPRKEEPMDIINDIIRGFSPGFKQFVVEVNREKAIEKALYMADKGDLVVIAGKGHEDYQIFKDKTIHFDDYEVVHKILKKME
ncbi:MAG: UDP-N-acetylmuramoyl-L-alanyl-D-glutamate--2,6-diaminopimelate ligase [Candidatus Aminicenantes bacterium]|nr:MAG: UDP-N-acetylmuramoyl-L-alanyl-D-glutamate--2,6-diaminopimelate ligase [Candidatus Aminicenantes bacterium]